MLTDSMRQIVGSKNNCMKNFVFLPLVGAITLAAAGSASAALLAYEPFNYGAGSVVGGSGGFGFTGSWAYNPIFEPAGTTGANVIASGLSYAGLTTSGGALTSVPNYEVADRTLFATAPTSGTFYLSFLISRVTGESPSYGGLSVFDASGTSEEMFLGFTGGGLGTDNPPATSRVLLPDQPGAAMMVFKFDFTLSTVTGFVNPVLGAPEPLVPAFTFNKTFQFARLGINADPGIIVDEIRLGNFYTDVVPVPEPGSVMLMICGLGTMVMWRRRAAN